MTSHDFALEIDGLGVCFAGRWVLRDFCLSLAAGERVALAGASGSGKSTVLKCALGLVVPEAGTIRIFGEELTGHSVWDLRRHLAYVAQEPDMGAGTMREVLEQPFRYRVNAALHGNLHRLPELMARFRLDAALLDKGMNTLSGGEKQRVALLSAILLDRRIILLDEASSALDKANKQAVADYLREDSGLTVLSVSHDSEWLGFSTRVVDLEAVV